jgi:hypothetical protein
MQYTGPIFGSSIMASFAIPVTGFGGVSIWCGCRTQSQIQRVVVDGIFLGIERQM